MKKNNVYRALFAALLSIIMVFGLLPIETFAAQEESHIGFTSDVHGNITNLESWYDNLPITLDNMAFGGDYSYKYSQLEYINDYNAVVSLTNNKIGAGRGVYTSGNHEYQNTTSLTDYPGILQIGEAVRADNYIIYCMGAHQGDNTGSFSIANINTLKAYLEDEDTPVDIPIFIVSHFPLHYILSRTIANADIMIDLLNEHPNTVFLWGHNHSQSDSKYGEIKSYGDVIQYNAASSKTINFTYACAGAMYSESQTSYGGLVASVPQDGSTVSFSYYKTNGSVINEKRSNSESVIVLLSNGVLPGPSGGATGDITYTKADALEAGKTYLIVATQDSDHYAMSNNVLPGSSDGYGYLLDQKISSAVSGTTVTLNADEADNLEWTANSSGSAYTLYNAKAQQYVTVYLAQSNYTEYGLKLGGGSDAAAWNFSGTKMAYAKNLPAYGNDASLYRSSKHSGFRGHSTSASTVSIYEKSNVPAEPIDNVDIVDIDAPAAGAVPDSSASVTTNTVVTPAGVSWLPADSTFKFDTAYTASITLSPKPGYEFALGTTATVNGAAAIAMLNANGTLTVSYTFAKTAAAPQYQYEYATAIEEGGTYVIVHKGSTSYALTTTAYSNYLRGKAVTITGDYLDPADVTDDVLFVFTADGSGYNVKNGGSFLTRLSGSPSGVKLQDTDAGAPYTDWEYDSSQHYFRIINSVGSYNYLYQTTDSGGNIYFTVSSSSSSKDKMYLYKQIEVLPTPISSAAVTDIDTPQAGASPDTTAAISTEGVAISQVSWEPDDNPFGYNTQYTASVTLTPQAGYAFSEDVTVTINGQAAQVICNADGTLTASYAFDATQAQPISGAELTVAEPVAGAVPDSSAAVTTAGVTASSVTWAPDDNPFDYNTQYTASVTLTPQAGYAFMEDATVTINGQAAQVICNADGTLTASYAFDATQTATDAELPNITGQPANVTVNEGEVAELTVQASVTKGTLSYQWYSHTADSNTNGTLITDAIQETCSAPTDAVGTTYYYCIITNTDNDATGSITAQAVSQTAKVVVNALTNAELPNITGQPANVTVNKGGVAELTVQASVTKGTLSYQWYSNAANSNTNGTLITGATQKTCIAPTDAVGTTYYYCVVTNTDNDATGSKTAQVVSGTCKVTVQEITYLISASANNASYGSVSGGGSYISGTSAALTAVPNQGYRFVGWTEGGTQVSANANYTFVVTQSRTLIAQFTALTRVGISCSKTNATLYGGANGSVTITASGGNSGTYQYSINGGASWHSSGVFGGLAAGTYTAAVRDAGYPSNVATCSVSAGQPKPLGSVAAKKIPSRANAGTAITIIPPAAPKGYTTQSVTYSSSKPSVAAVDASGHVTFLAGGKATVTARIVCAKTDSRGRVKTKITTVKKTVTVTQPVESISLNLSDVTIARAQKVKLTPSFAPATASSKKVKWVSSNKKVAAVSSSGVVTGKAGGTAVITCTARDGSNVSVSCIVTVTPIFPTGVTLSKTSLSIKPGRTATLRATVAPKNTDYKAVTWKSSNPAIATVDAKGKVKAISPGTAVITATTSYGHQKSCTVTVK